MGTALESRYLSEPEDVSSVFRFFRDQQSEITLRFADVENAFTARVLDLEPNRVLLQNIIPASGAELLAQGTPFSISGRADGLFVYISENRALANEALAVNGCYRIPLPVSVLYQQRRRASRYRLPVKVDIHRSYIQLSAEPERKGRILDISEGGARILLDPAKTDTVLINDEFRRCRILVPHALDIEVHVGVRHTNYNPVGQRLACGLQILTINAANRRELDAFLKNINPFS